jgi:predicted P-loop ATPase
VGSVSDKDERLKLHQAWIVEWAELESVFKRKDVSAVKAFITTQADSIRPPYARAVKEFPRPSIIVGTTNFDEFLADPTGNRRFWVVPVEADTIPLEELAQERDRIWAAATHAFLTGEQWTLPTEYRAAQIEANAEYQMSDPWEAVVQDYCQNRTQVTAAGILSDALNMDLDRQDKASQMRVTNLLKGMSWTTSRLSSNGRRVRFWFSPNLPKEVVQVGQIELKPPENIGGQPPAQPPISEKQEVENSGLPNLPNLDSLFPKSGRTRDFPLCKPLEIGEKIYLVGKQFFGVRVTIEAIDGEKATVRGSTWVISRDYPFSDLARELPCRP